MQMHGNYIINRVIEVGNQVNFKSCHADLFFCILKSSHTYVCVYVCLSHFEMQDFKYKGGGPNIYTRCLPAICVILLLALCYFTVFKLSFTHSFSLDIGKFMIDGGINRRYRCL